MNIYSDYLKTIKSAMAGGKGVNESFRHLSHFDGKDNLSKALNYGEIKSQISEKKLLPSLADFAQEIGRTADFDKPLGLHPDFSHLKGTNSMENHYIVSVFIDIKGSTHLFKRYTPEQVSLITNSIQRVAIHTCLLFGGYVQRLHGDGLFVYYGGKGQDISDAVLRALQSCSVFTYFVKTDLKQVFDQQGIEEIATRIGIDLGYDKDVVWNMAGIGEVSEITTCSLHTSLASKMQSNAQTNGIVIGDNIRSESLKWDEHYSVVSQRTQVEADRYIYRIPEERFNYTQYDFEWLGFLGKQDFIATDPVTEKLTMKRKVVKHEHRVPQTLKPVAAVNTPYSR